MTATLDPAASPTPRPPRRWRRRLLLWGAGLLTLIIAAPWALNLRPVRTLVLRGINARLAPGSITVQNWSVAWVRPIRVEGLALVDPKGKSVATAREVRLDRGILGLLLTRPDIGTITVDGATIDVERRVDGTIDILDALASLTKPDPDEPNKRSSSRRTAVKVVLRDGKLRASSPELPEPIVAGNLAADLTIAPDHPMALAATLTDGDRSVQLTAQVTPPPPNVPDAPETQAKAAAATSDLTVRVVGKDWPLAFRGDGGLGRGRFSGTLDARRTGGLWSASTVSALDDFEADGPALRGDHPRIDRVTLVADLAQNPAVADAGGGWSVRRFEAACPVGKAQATGVIPPAEGSSTALQAQVDLAALARLLPHTLALQPGLTVDRGTANLTAHLTGLRAAERAEIIARVADFTATRAGRPITVAESPRLEAVATRTGSRVAVETVTLKASGIDISGSGDLDAGVTLKGVIDLDALDAQVREFVDLGKVQLAGHARLGADYRRQGDEYKARLAVDCRNLHVAGLTTDPIDRPSARLDASATGPRLADGRPNGWTTAKLDAKAGDFQVDLAATREADGTLRFGGLGATDLPGQGQGWVEAKLAARWQSQVLAFDEAHIWLMPSGSKTTHKAGPNTLNVAARGRVDFQAGTATFEAIPDLPAGAIGISSEGVKVAGWRSVDTAWRGQAGLIGDLAALDRFLAERDGRPASGWAGPWSAAILASRDGVGPIQASARVGATDLLGYGSTTLDVRGSYLTAGDRVTFDAVDLTTRYGDLKSHATIDHPATTREFDWSGTLAPRWDLIGPILAHRVEPGLKVEAQTKPFHLAGTAGGGSLVAIAPTLRGELGLDIATLTAFGVQAGPLPVVLKLADGHARFDPIATNVNGGTGFFQGGLLVDEAGGVALKLGESRIDNAAINDAVSSSVLSFIAPILSRATEVSGKVSVVLTPEGALIPITSTSLAQAQGVIAFQNVIFRPGPLADEVFSLTGQTAPKLAFAEPVQFSVIDGRVQQSGLSVPLPGGNKVEFAGSVGFDKTLQVAASVPITAAMVGRDAQVERLLNGLKVKVPIGGTLSRPVIDRSGLRDATRDAIRTVANREMKNQSGKLIDRVAAGIKVPGVASGDAAAKAAPATGTAADPKRELLRGLLEGLDGETKPKP